VAPVQIRVSPLSLFLLRKKSLAEKESNMFYVYVLKCRDDSLYTGYTNDIKKRLKMHNDGKASKYTRSRRPVKLIAQWPFKNKSEAMKHEIKFKALPRKEKIKSIERCF